MDIILCLEALGYYPNEAPTSPNLYGKSGFVELPILLEVVVLSDY